MARESNIMSGTGRPERRIAIIGGGFSGSLLALKLTARRPDWLITLIDPAVRPGRGLAYGACAPYHLLNVPAHRMEVGLAPAFQAWLQDSGQDLDDALDESSGDLADAFLPRRLLGDYLQARLAAAPPSINGQGLRRVRGEAVGVMEGPGRGVRLFDGREIEADIVVLATGNLPPKAPFPADSWLQDHPAFIPDPWANGALSGLDPAAPVLLLGTGLTMVDIALRLAEEGQTGPMLAISRRGLAPTAHQAGGAWAPFLTPMLPASPLTLCRAVRQAAAQAGRENLPWQRVMDAVRPSIAQVWLSWSEAQKRQFLRHLRPRWDIHRHRMAPRVAARLDGLVESGALTVMAGRLRDWTRQGDQVSATLVRRGGAGSMAIRAGTVINCTGPRSDLVGLAVPLFSDLSRRGLILPDRLGLGLESDDCAVLDHRGKASSWLYAVGPLTRPALWEITAVPEITAQLDRLSLALSRDEAPATSGLAETFVDMGAGI
jgi:uncharacterized NAD(P)/FAD-binding protein YdhS